MAQNTAIRLDDHFAGFLSREVETGRYRSASEVVRAGLRLLEDQEAHVATLRATLTADGRATTFVRDTAATASAAIWSSMSRKATVRT